MGKILVTNIKGPSAYDIAVAEGFVGTEAEWLLSLKGATGDVTPAATAAKTAAEAAASTAAQKAADAAEAAASVPTEAELSATYVTGLIYSGGAYPPRPIGAASVKYIGPVVPTTWLPNDEWVDNS